MSELFDFKNYQWRKMAKNGDGEFAFFICQIRHFAIGPPPQPSLLARSPSALTHFEARPRGKEFRTARQGDAYEVSSDSDVITRHPVTKIRVSTVLVFLSDFVVFLYDPSNSFIIRLS